MKNKTINKTGYLISGILTHAVDLGVIETNPYKGIKKLPEEPVEKHALTKYQIFYLIEFLIGYKNVHQAMCILFALFIPLRMGNCIALKWSMIDFESMEILIPRTKSGKSHRIPFNELVMAILQTCRKNAVNEYVFPSTVKHRDHISYPRFCYEKAKEYMEEKTGNKNHWTLHSLRRTNATLMLRATGDIRMVQQVLSHSCVTTTELYATHRPKSMATAINSTAELIAPNQAELINKIGRL